MSDKQFKVVIPGVDGGGAQVFEADSQDELVEKLKTAQENATAKIRELAQNNEALSQQMQQNGGQAQQSGQTAYNKDEYITQFYNDPMKALDQYFEQRLGTSPDQFLNDYQQVRAGSQKAVMNEVSAVFAQSHPELLQVSAEEDKHNANVISQILTDNGWSYNVKNLEAAYAVAKVEGKLKLGQTSPFPEATLLPSPTTITRPTGAVNNSASEEEFLQTAPLSKVKEYLEKKYAGSRG